MLHAIDLGLPDGVGPGDLPVLAGSVNAQRMDNYPVILTTGELEEGYRGVFGM